MASRADLTIDLCWRLQGSIQGEQTVQRDTKEGLILLEIRADEVPILDSECSKLTAVELVIRYLMPGVPHIDGPTGGEGEKVPAGIGSIQIMDGAIIIATDAVHNHEPS